MAEEMSQAEIDKLLKIADTFEENDKISEATTVPPGRNFRAAKPRELRFHFPYQSPILSPEDYIFNPDPKGNISQDKTVVRGWNDAWEKYQIEHRKF